MPDSSPTTVRSYRPGDEQALVELFQRVFGRAITEDHWMWKLEGQPATVDNVWLAVSADRPVFQYAGIPTRFRLSQATVTSMVCVDTMTAPEFRRRGLFRGLRDFPLSDPLAYLAGINERCRIRAMAG